MMTDMFRALHNDLWGKKTSFITIADLRLGTDAYNFAIQMSVSIRLKIVYVSDLDSTEENWFEK